jgi:hypothetical protein
MTTKLITGNMSAKVIPRNQTKILTEHYNDLPNFHPANGRTEGEKDERGREEDVYITKSEASLGHRRLEIE